MTDYRVELAALIKTIGPGIERLLADDMSVVENPIIARLRTELASETAKATLMVSEQDFLEPAHQARCLEALSYVGILFARLHQVIRQLNARKLGGT